MSTSQASLELFALLSIGLVFLSLVGSFYVREKGAAFQEFLFFEARETATLAAGAVDQAYLGGTGYSRNLTLPESVGPYNYSLFFSEGHVYIVLSNYSLSSAEKAIPREISGSFAVGKKNLVRNVGGEVFVSEAP